MAVTRLAREERFALPLAVALHVVLIVALLWKPVGDAIIQQPERVAVTLTDEVGLVTTAPNPVLDAAPPAESDFVEPEPTEQPEVANPDTPRERTAPRTDPRTSSARPTRAPPRTSPPTRQPESKIDSNFLGGQGTNESSKDTGTPATQIGPRIQNSINAAIVRQLKRHWSAPQGVDVELLVTRVRFRLNPDGTLLGAPQVISQTGKNASNAAQAERHKEQAIRAVRLAAPFNLPEEYYDGWKTVTTNFDRRL